MSPVTRPRTPGRKNSDRVAGIILAAGAAKRYGSCKQVTTIGGKPLLTWVIDAALKSRLTAVYIVMDFRQEEIRDFWAKLPRNPNLIPVDTSSQAKEMSASMKIGLAAAGSGNHTAAMFLLGDQPFIETEFINRMLTGCAETDRKICVASCNGRYRNPVIFHRRFWPELMGIDGDVGGRRVILANPEQVTRVECTNQKLFLDIDTPEDIKKAAQMLGRRPK